MPKHVKVLDDEDLKQLRLIYEPHIPYTTHVVSLIDNHFLSKVKHPNKTFVEFLTLGDEWKLHGTFLMRFNKYDLFTYTLSENGDEIYELLKQTNALKVKRLTVCYGIRNEHLPPLYRALKEEEVPIKRAIECTFYWLPKEKALQYTIDCPEDVYLDELDKTHVKLIASVWPHAFADAEEYIALLLEMNYGYGVFLKDGDKLVSWILKTHWGTLVILETLPEYKRRGYAVLVTKKLCKKIAQEGINPLCTILVGNTISETMFKKLGFEYIKNNTFVVL